MLFFNSKPKSSYKILIALKSSSIDLQLVRIPENGPREVLFVQRKIILLDNSQDPQLYTKQCITELVNLLTSSAKTIQQLSKGKIEQTVILLYAPWFTSNISNIFHKEHVVITEKFIANQFKTIKTPEQLINLEKKTLKILTNGYSITELSESKFSNISLDIYSSYISKKIHEAIVDTVHKALPIYRNISYITSPILMFNNIRSLLVHEDNASFIFVGGEITEVGTIEADSLTYFATFPIGKHDFLREVQGSVKTLDYDLLYQKEIQIKQPGKQKDFEALKAQWSDMLIQTILNHDKDVSSKLIVITDSKSKEFFVNQLINGLKSRQRGVMGQYRIINFDMSRLEDIITYKTPTYRNELDLQLEALI